jgi:outer membrane protein
MKTIAFLLAPVLIIAPAARAQDSLTVDQAVRRALASNPAVVQALANAAAAGARASQARSLKYPAVSAEAQAVRIGPVPELTIPLMGTFKFYPEDNYDAHVAARFTVFDFGRTSAAVDQGRLREESSHEALEMTRTALAVQTARAFYAVLYLEQSARVQEEQIEALNGHLEATRKRVAAGTATDLDALTTRVRVATAQGQKIDIENAVQKQRTVLRQLMNAPADEVLSLRGEFLADSASVDADSLAGLALRGRPEIALARDAEQAARIQVRLAGLGRLPALRLNVSYGSKNGYIPDLDKMRANWAAGIRAEMPVWEGGRIGRQEEEAKAQHRAEEAHLQDVERQIRSDVEQAAADVSAAQAKIRISEVQLMQAGDAARMARARYETGSVTNLDLLDAEAAESAARLARLQALYRSVVSRIDLSRAAGRFPGGE